MECIVDMNTRIEFMKNFIRIELRHEDDICVYIKKNERIWTGYQEILNEKWINDGFPRIIYLPELCAGDVWIGMVRGSSAKDLDKVCKIIEGTN